MPTTGKQIIDLNEATTVDLTDNILFRKQGANTDQRITGSNFAKSFGITSGYGFSAVIAQNDNTIIKVTPIGGTPITQYINGLQLSFLAPITNANTQMKIQVGTLPAKNFYQHKTTNKATFEQLDRIDATYYNNVFYYTNQFTQENQYSPECVLDTSKGGGRGYVTDNSTYTRIYLKSVLKRRSSYYNGMIVNFRCPLKNSQNKDWLSIGTIYVNVDDIGDVQAIDNPTVDQLTDKLYSGLIPTLYYDQPTNRFIVNKPDISANNPIEEVQIQQQQQEIAPPMPQPPAPPSPSEVKLPSEHKIIAQTADSINSQYYFMNTDSYNDGVFTYNFVVSSNNYTLEQALNAANNLPYSSCASILISSEAINNPQLLKLSGVTLSGKVSIVLFTENNATLNWHCDQNLVFLANLRLSDVYTGYPFTINFPINFYSSKPSTLFSEGLYRLYFGKNSVIDASGTTRNNMGASYIFIPYKATFRNVNMGHVVFANQLTYFYNKSRGAWQPFCDFKINYYNSYDFVVRKIQYHNCNITINFSDTTQNTNPIIGCYYEYNSNKRIIYNTTVTCNNQATPILGAYMDGSCYAEGCNFGNGTSVVTINPNIVVDGSGTNKIELYNTTGSTNIEPGSQYSRGRIIRYT